MRGSVRGGWKRRSNVTSLAAYSTSRPVRKEVVGKVLEIQQLAGYLPYCKSPPQTGYNLDTCNDLSSTSDHFCRSER